MYKFLAAAISPKIAFVLAGSCASNNQDLTDILIFRQLEVTFQKAS